MGIPAETGLGQRVSSLVGALALFVVSLARVSVLYPAQEPLAVPGCSDEHAGSKSANPRGQNED